MKQFRTFSQPSPKGYIGLVLSWCAIALVALYGWGCFKSGGKFTELSQEFLKYCGPISALCLLAGLLLGGIHYTLLRVFSKNRTRRFGWKETACVIVATAMIAAYPVFFTARIYQKSKWVHACWQEGLHTELKSMLAKGDVHGAVVRMEQACQLFRDARIKLGKDFENYRRNRGHSGIGYLYTTLAYSFDSLELNTPVTLCNYFDSDPLFEGSFKLNHPEKCAKLGREMSLSKTPILRALGYYFMEDRGRFSEVVYEQYNAGDRTYQTLVPWVAFQIDPDPKRAIHELLRCRKNGIVKGGMNSYVIENFDSRVFTLASALTKAGQDAGDDTPAVREAIQRYVRSEKFKDDLHGALPGKEIENRLLNWGVTLPNAN